jgi:hypothetical protein
MSTIRVLGGLKLSTIHQSWIMSRIPDEIDLARSFEVQTLLAEGACGLANVIPKLLDPAGHHANFV